MSIRSQIPKTAFEAGILDPSFHSRLLDNVDEFVSVAGIRPNFLWEPASSYCTEEERKWVRNLKSSTDAGAVVVHKGSILAADACMALAGALLRNYIDARVIPLHTIISMLEDHDPPEPTVLFIPDLLSKDLIQKSIASWRVQEFVGLIMDRYNKNLKTVLYSNYEGMQVRSIYGDAFLDLIQTHYTTITRED